MFKLQADESFMAAKKKTQQQRDVKPMPASLPLQKLLAR
jgi:hypothetical protein